ncbi:MAG: DUF2791 family P-loop domain-containing protein [Deltaproteobacteria bacterium]|nr:DUF2791 family P-loop domain-containing protein [Myxococcales bacterium]MDP3216208.1 DUF2791 family P-loop domain-containing protein [Deltaproteobacteria bacterium]
MALSPRTSSPPDSPEDAWQSALLRAAQQGMEDVALTGAAEVLFLRAKRASAASAWFDALADAAWTRGLCVARVGVLSDRCFDTLDGLVRNLVQSLRAPGASRDRGWTALLDAFLATHASPGAALAAFDREAARFGAHGDLAVLTREYLDAAGRPARPASRIDAWLAGTDLSRVESRGAALSALSAPTALRALGECSRLVRALGHRGLLLVFEGAEVLTRLSASRRDGGFTVLRELIDNADGARGLVSAQLWVGATALLYDGARGISLSGPLASRVLAPAPASDDLPPPHRPLVDLSAPAGWRAPAMLPIPLPAVRSEAAGLRAILRSAHGLPPVDPDVGLSVGHEHIDATIDELFRHASLESSVFALVSGVYGSGKSHLLMHLTARSLAERRPVFRLSLEYLDADLGHPQRHLFRMLDQAVLPLPGRPSALDRLVAWTRTTAAVESLRATLEAIAEGAGDAAGSATKLLGRMRRSKRPGAVAEAFLSTSDLRVKPASATYRKDAYQRLLLWLELLARVDGCRGPMILVDEAENLFRAFTAPQRRAALRSLSYYCGGTLPGSCVVLAITPDALDRLRGEADALLADVAEQRTVLPSEDAAMLRHRLHQAKPMAVPTLDEGQRVVLAFKVQALHRRVRAPTSDPRWASWVTETIASAATPRELVRRAVDRLEGLWWRSTASVGDDA